MIAMARKSDDEGEEALMAKVMELVCGRSASEVVTTLMTVAIDAAVTNNGGNLDRAREGAHKTLDNLFDSYRDEVLDHFTGDDE